MGPRVGNNFSCYPPLLTRYAHGRVFYCEEMVKINLEKFSLGQHCYEKTAVLSTNCLYSLANRSTTAISRYYCLMTFKSVMSFQPLYRKSKFAFCCKNPLCHLKSLDPFRMAISKEYESHFPCPYLCGSLPTISYC